MLPFRKSASDSEYLLAPDSASIEEHSDLEPDYAHRKRRNSSLWKILAILELLAIVILGMVLVLRHAPKPVPFHTLKSTVIYLILAPAASVIEYEMKRFHASPPSPEIDELWHDLYAYGVSQLTKEQADMLPLKTSEIPGVPGKYITSLSVFHHLHCLNSLRKSLYPANYPDMDPADDATLTHLNHSITCSQMLALGLAWNEQKNRSTTVLRVPHTCMNWNKLQAWAVDNAAEKFDSTIKMEGTPVFQDDV
ncbi:hypothetical protein BDQ17DRAFT_1373092 [Cyathus striatus]|nr:hypothetical protein BDQ17DRAFT_1373092 [Cyathus striatus]